MKSKNTTRILALLVVMAVALSAAALAADWPTFQQNNNHNGVIADSAPTSASPDIESLELTNNGSGWDGVDTTPVMQTVGGTTYAYIVYDGYAVSGGNGGGRLAKVNCDTGEQVWSKQLTLSSGFQLSTPLLVQGGDPNSEADDTLYVGTTGYSQLLQNDELYDIPSNPWTVGGSGVQGDGYVAITGNNSATLTQGGFSMSSTPTNRAAVGVWVGNSANPGIAMTITVSLNGTNVVTQSFPANSTAIEDQANPGNYYYYVNTNFAAGSYSAPIAVTVNVTSGNNGTVRVEYVRLYQQTGSVQRITNLDQASPTAASLITGISGQINTPITTDGTYIYFGTWAGGSSPGTYYQVRLSDGNTKTFTPASYGFYWAGAAVLGNYVYFGGDNARLYYRSVANFDTSGGVINLTSYQASAGDVRSSICAYGGSLYFTSKGGYLWKFTPDRNGTPQHDWNVQLPAASTSTPVITPNGRLYVSYYNGFTSGGVVSVNISNQSMTTIVNNKGPVQSSVAAYVSGSTDYVYFTTNDSDGAGYCYSYDGGSVSAVWDTEGAGGLTYTLQGMAASDGYLVFGNDYDNVYIVHAA